MAAKTRRDAGRARGEPIVDAILEHTLADLSRAGIDGLSIDRIARAAAVNKTTIYRRWPTRESLVAAALGRILIDRSLTVPDTGSLQGDLVAVLAPIGELLDSALGKAGLRLALSDSAALLADLTLVQVARTASPMLDMISRARARGEWSEDTDPMLLSFMLVGALMHRVVLERQPPVGDWLHALVGQALRGVYPRPRA